MARWRIRAAGCGIPVPASVAQTVILHMSECRMALSCKLVSDTAVSAAAAVFNKLIIIWMPVLILELKHEADPAQPLPACSLQSIEASKEALSVRQLSQRAAA